MDPHAPHPSNFTLGRRGFIGWLTTAAAASNGARLVAAAPAEAAALGPIVGHMEATQGVIWFRPMAAGDYTLEISPVTGGTARTFPARAREENDLCLHWHVGGLSPATRYRYRIVAAPTGTPVAEDAGQTFTTAALPGAPARVRFAIGSCAREDAGTRAVWKRIAEENADAVILLGDTPYIDSTELAVQTRRHREFAAVPEYQHLLRARPCWWTWDDHDFGANDSSGLLPGKENSRLVYSRYRPQAGFGDGREGIYTRARYGPVELFILDTRWFVMTEPSPARPAYPTILGAKQWEWLTQGLLASTAPFKLIACGMIWDDKQGAGRNMNDSWGGFLHERRELEKFILNHRLPGVVLLGGDIHVSRVLRYKSLATAGYNLVQYISSPIHAGVIPALNVFHPDLVRSAVEPNVFLLLEADSTVNPPRLEGTLINAKGERVFSYGVSLAELTPR
jgi:alkaline phosphatase D